MVCLSVECKFLESTIKVTPIFDIVCNKPQSPNPLCCHYNQLLRHEGERNEFNGGLQLDPDEGDILESITKAFK